MAGLENLTGLQNVDFSGGLGGMLGGIHNMQVDDYNQAMQQQALQQLFSTQLNQQHVQQQMEQEAGKYPYQLEILRQQADTDPRLKTLDKQAKYEQAQREALYPVLTAIRDKAKKALASGDLEGVRRASAMFDNISSQLSPQTRTILSSGASPVTGGDTNTVAPSFDPDTLDSFVNTMDRSKGMWGLQGIDSKNASAEKRTADTNASRERIAQLMAETRAAEAKARATPKDAKTLQELATRYLSIYNGLKDSTDPIEREHAEAYRQKYNETIGAAQSLLPDTKPQISPEVAPKVIVKPERGGQVAAPTSKTALPPGVSLIK